MAGKRKAPKNSIHPTTVIDPSAEIAWDVEVGPYSIIGPGVRIFRGTKIGPHVNLFQDTTIGEDCKIYFGASIGTDPQDLKYRGERTFAEIGDRTVIREHVTINRGTTEGSVTRVGEDSFLMAYSHVAHNCFVGDRVIIANAGTLAGHVEIEDGAIIGGVVGIHQFCRIGTLSIIGGCSKVVQDVPPYSMVDGNPGKVRSINTIGLKRNGVSPALQADIKKAYKLLFRSKRNLSRAVEEVRRVIPPSPEVQHLIDFILGSERGICR